MYRLVSRDEMRAPLPQSFKLWAWRNGYEARHAALYDRAGMDAGEYVTDYERRFLCSRLNPVPSLFSEKMLLRQFLFDRGFAQPETIALITRHGIIADPLVHPMHLTGRQLEERLVTDGGRYIVKPQDGLFGRNIFLVDSEGGRGLVTRRGRAARPFVLARDAQPVAMVERSVEQHPFWNTLAPYSVNTIRVLTMWTPGDGEPFVGRAVQRIGTAETLPTDNWAGGSICAPVDLATGTLGVGRMSPDDAGRRRNVPYERHPDTGAQIAGVTLPGWESIKAVVLAAARSVPYARYVGWDVAIDPAGVPVFIEGNHNSSVDLLQVHGGLLKDPAVRRFYERCGVIGAGRARAG